MYLTTRRGADRTVFECEARASALASLKPIAYGDVFDRLEGELSIRLQAEGKSQKRVSNFRTARNCWMKEFGLTEDRPVGIEFGAGFTGYLERYSTALAAEGKNSQTIADRRSMMGAYRETWVSLRQSETPDVLEGDFAQALDRLIKLSGACARAIAGRAGVEYETFRKWRSGHSWPSKRLLPAVQRLEEIFHLPFGVLAAKLPKVLFGAVGPLRTGLTGYRQHVAVTMRLRYLLQEFPPSLQAEWNDLVLFFTDAAWLRTRGLRRNSKWRVREHDNRCPTADYMHHLVREFMGYLCLPADSEDPRLRGKGFQAEELTMGLLSDSDLMYNFLQFKRERTYLKCYNGLTYTFLTFGMTLLRRQTGFLWQLPEFGARLPVQVRSADWHQWCERQRLVLKTIRKDLMREEDFKKSRDPFVPIRPIVLNYRHPLDVLFELADTYEADAPPIRASSHHKAVHFQNLLLIKFTTLIPLRVFNLSVMTWRLDGTGNLYQRSDGSWWVRFDPSYLKNHKGAAKGHPLDVPLHPSLWSYVEDFLFVHRPHLGGAAVCDYVFRPNLTHKETESRRAGRPVNRGTLSRLVYKITQRYIPNCPGFSVHAFRHLVATEYIKNNPAGYAVAAAVLYDKEETIRKNYAWVLPADKFAFWNDYVSTVLSARVKEDVQGEEDDE